MTLTEIKKRLNLQYIMRNNVYYYGRTKSFWSIICLYLLILDPAIPPIKVFGGAPFSILICGVYILSKYGRNKRISINTYFKKILIGYILIFSYSLLRIAINGAIEPSYVNVCIRAGLTLFAVILYINAFYDNDKIIGHIIYVLVFAGLMSVLAVQFKPLMDLALYFKAGEVDITLVDYNPYRVSYLSGNGFFGIAVLYFISQVFMTVCFCFNIYKIKTSNFIVIFTLFSVFGCLAGRVMFIAIVINLMIMFFKKIKVLCLLILFIIITIAFVSQVTSLMTVPSFDKLSRWMFEFYFSYKDTGVASSNSTQQLFDMLKVNANVNYIFGDAAFRNGDAYYGNVDIGFIRHLYFGGIFFFMLLYLIYLPLISGSLKHITNMVLLICGLILEFKGNVIFDSGPFMTLYFIFIFHLQENINSNIKFNSVKNFSDKNYV